MVKKKKHLEKFTKQYADHTRQQRICKVKMLVIALKKMNRW
jgi:hypothetical protein